MNITKLSIILSLFFCSSAPVFCSQKTKSPSEQLYRLITRNSTHDFTKIKELIKKGADVNYIECVPTEIGGKGYALLITYHNVVSRRNLRLLKFLAKNGLRVNIKDEKGRIGLHRVTRSQWGVTPPYNNSCEVDSPDPDDEISLEIAKFLVSLGEDPNAKDDYGDKPSAGGFVHKEFPQTYAYLKSQESWCLIM